MRRLYFRNFPLTYTDDQVKAFFEPFGPIQRFKLIKDAEGQSIGAGLITLEDQAAEAVLNQLAGTEVEGQAIGVEHARSEGTEAERALATRIAQELGETESQPQNTIRNVIRVMGTAFAEELLVETWKVESEGGLMLSDGSRRRTPGGVFFYLVRGCLDKNTFHQIFPTAQPKNGQTKSGKAGKKKSASEPSQVAEFPWAERLSILQELLPEKGMATTVKMTLVGRPGKIKKMQDVTILVMEHTLKNAALPKGVPQPPQTPTLYTVYIGMKQWKKVEEAIKNPEDVLVVEGQGAFDPQIQGMALFASNVTTKLLQQAQKAQQTSEAAGKSQAPKASPTPASQLVKPAQAASLNQEQAQALLANLHDQLTDAQGKLQRKEGSAFSLSQQIFKLEQEIKDLKRKFPGLG